MTRISPVPPDVTTPESQDKRGRLVFVDALRVVAILMVIAHHAAQAYGPTGGSWPVTDTANSDWFGPFFRVNAAFGMGLLFLLAGYFVPRSYDRKGARQFSKERWLRIGVPMVIFILVVHVPILYLLGDSQPSAGEFVRSLYDDGWRDLYAHLWFLGHLLLYSAGYVMWRRFSERRSTGPRRKWPVPSHAMIAGFVIALAIVTWIVRVWYPVDVWVPLFFVLAAEPAHLPQYVSLFALGAIAYRGDWLRRISTTTGMVWLTIGVVASAAVYATQLLPAEQLDDSVAIGGFSWQSLTFSLWEALICVGLVLGLIIMFRMVIHKTGHLLLAMVAVSYAAYILHLAIVITLQTAIEGVGLPAFIKFGIVTLFGVVIAFGIGLLSRRVPGVRTILGTTPPQQDRSEQQSASKQLQ